MPDLFQSLIQQESGGRPGVVGPRTKYGRALGMTQMLPATAREMAGKLGLPWDPALMTDKSDRGAAYQRQLGEAYFQEGLKKTGNPRDALRYYHGGPNRAQWGPKTNAYADEVLARANGGPQPMIRPRKPQTLADLAGNDPPQPTMGLPSFAGMGGPIEQMPVSTLGDVAALAPGKKGVFGSGIGIGELLVHGLNGYLAGRGNPVGAANMNMISEARENEQQMQFDRERFNQQLAMKREEAMRRAAEPPAFIRDALALQAAGPQVQSAVASMYDVRSPTLGTYYDEQGNQRQGVYSRSQGGFVGQRSGPPPEAIAELRDAVSSGDSSAIAEFEEVFGPGSARAVMGDR